MKISASFPLLGLLPHHFYHFQIQMKTMSSRQSQSLICCSGNCALQVTNTFVLTFSQGPGEESLLSSLLYDISGVSMQDGDSDQLLSMTPVSHPSRCRSCSAEIDAFSSKTSPNLLCEQCQRCVVNLRGVGPGKRAGHTATAVGRR